MRMNTAFKHGDKTGLGVTESLIRFVIDVHSEAEYGTELYRESSKVLSYIMRELPLAYSRVVESIDPTE